MALDVLPQTSVVVYVCVHTFWHKCCHNSSAVQLIQLTKQVLNIHCAGLGEAKMSKVYELVINALVLDLRHTPRLPLLLSQRLEAEVTPSSWPPAPGDVWLPGRVLAPAIAIGLSSTDGRYVRQKPV